MLNVLLLGVGESTFGATHVKSFDWAKFVRRKKTSFYAYSTQFPREGTQLISAKHPLQSLHYFRIVFSIACLIIDGGLRQNEFELG